MSVSDAITIKGNSAVLRCVISPIHIRPWIRVTSWVHEEGAAIEILAEKDPGRMMGKYTLLQPSGHLLVHHTSAYDSYKKYTCKAQHILTGERRRSQIPARITLTGKRHQNMQ